MNPTTKTLTLWLLMLACMTLHAQKPNTLDLIGLTADEPAATAYSLRKLSSTYTGPAIQVSASFGGDTKDIGFNAQNYLDTATLHAFCNSCLIYKWYDQSGNGRDAVIKVLSPKFFPPTYRAVDGALRFRKWSIFRTNYHSGLETDPFTAFQGGFSVFVVASKNDVTSDAMVTKTNQNYPSPWDMYNSSILTVSTDGGQWLNTLNLPTEVDSAKQVYAYNGSPESKAIGSLKNFDGYVKSTTSMEGSFAKYDAGTPQILGSREDAKTGFTGRLWEVITFPKKYEFSSGTALGSFAEQLIKNQVEYFDILDPLGIPEHIDASLALSLRKLSPDYNGPAIQVSNGSKTQNIDFLPTGQLDTLALKKFCGSSTCRVVTWYDQSGNGLNATQSNAAQQPLIMEKGIVQRRKGKPMVYFDFNTENKPDASNTVFLSTPNFDAFDSEFTLFIAGGAEKAVNPFSTLVTKTKGIYPSPWNLFNDYYIVGNPVPWYSHPSAQNFWLNFKALKMNKPLTDTSVHVWSFSAQQGEYFHAHIDGTPNISTGGSIADVGGFGGTGCPRYSGQ